MTITPEDLAAFADGELDPQRAAHVAEAVAADPALAAQVAAHKALRARLGAHFAPILDAPVSEALSAPLRPAAAEVVDLAAARERREHTRTLPRWTWLAAPALAASLVLAVFLRGGGDAGGYAQGPLVATLDTQLAAGPPGDGDTRILLSFRDKAGDYCRAFAGAQQSGIACRDARGWRMVAGEGGVEAQRGDYRMAGSADVLALAQELADGPALDAQQEQAARARGWR